MTTTLRLCAVAVVAAVGIALKLNRYLPERAAFDVAAVEAHVERVMRRHGWLRSPLVEDRTANLYPRMQFRRPECAQPLTVAVLAGNGEAADYFLVQHAGDAAFLQEGLVRERPSGWTRQLASLRSQITAVGADDSDRPPLPLLAIAPRPDGGALCRGPSAQAWIASDTGGATR